MCLWTVKIPVFFRLVNIIFLFNGWRPLLKFLPEQQNYRMAKPNEVSALMSRLIETSGQLEMIK